MKNCSKSLYTLHLDVRKFFPSIDRIVLEKLIRNKIKDEQLLSVMKQFYTCLGMGKGIPLGNLLSQLYALIYLNPADHYIKRKLKICRYVRYVDDMVLIGMSSAEASMARKNIEEYLFTRLHLHLSKWSKRTVADGINFVGYRTWPTHRLIRKYSLCKFKKAVLKGNIITVGSIIAHSQKTSSIKILKSVILNNAAMVSRLPQSHQGRLGLCYQ